MELSRPGADLLGDTEAASLLVLARMHEPVSGRDVARRAAASPSSTRRALERLQRAGLVHARASSHAILYMLNREHVLWPPLLELLTGPARLERELGRLVHARAGTDATLALFGSVARGEATADSDIDLLLLLPDDTVDADREDLIDELTDLVQQRTGNIAQILTVTHQQFRVMAEIHDPLIASLTEDARTLTGTSLTEVIARAHQAIA